MVRHRLFFIFLQIGTETVPLVPSVIKDLHFTSTKTCNPSYENRIKLFTVLADFLWIKKIPLLHIDSVQLLCDG